MRSSFLVRDGRRVEASWMLGGELPDLDEIIAAAARLDS
jgi:hypothetical protein